MQWGCRELHVVDHAELITHGRSGRFISRSRRLHRQLTQQNPEHTYTLLNVTDSTSGMQNKVEPVAEFLNNPVVPSELGPVLRLDDVAAGTTTALDGRAEVRDTIDVDGLLDSGHTRIRLRELARQNDGGFAPRTSADSLGRIQRYTDKQFAAYDLTPATPQDENVTGN